jgi:Tape measure protein
MSTKSVWYQIILKDDLSPGIKTADKNADHLEKTLSNINRTALQTGNIFKSVFGGTIIANWAMKAGDALAGMATDVVRLGTDMERTKVVLDTLLGGSQAFTSYMVKEFQNFALNTNYSTSSVIEGAKRLSAYQFAVQDLLPTLKKLGDVAAGTGADLNDLIFVYGSTKQSGTVNARDLRQFGERGVPIYNYLEKVTGIKADQLRDSASNHILKFQDIVKAFDLMTSKGEKFDNLMAKVSGTTGGRWERLKDALEVIQTKLGEELNPVWNKMLDDMFTSVSNLSTVNMTPLVTSLDSMRKLGVDLVATFETLVGIFQTPTLSGDNHGWLDSLGRITRAVGYLGETAKLAGSYLAHPIDAAQGKFESFGGLFDRQDAKEREIIALSKPQNKVNNNWARDMLYDKAAADKEMQAINKKTGIYPVGSGSGQDGEIGAEKISSATKNITLNINQLVGGITFESTIDGSKAETINAVKQVLLQAVNDTNLVSQ